MVLRGQRDESSCGSGGTGIAGTECEWCCLWEIWQKKAEGEEHGLKDDGRGSDWDERDCKGVQKSSRRCRDYVVLETGENSGEERGIT